MNNFSFGNYICELREKKGLSQAEFGEKLGVTNKAVSKWENAGAYPSTELMLPLAKVLGVTIEDLYKSISESKEKKTRIRMILEYIVSYSKTITIVCFALIILPFALFALFSNDEGKLELLIAIPIICAVIYAMFYFMFILFRRNPFASSKVLDIYSIIILVAMLYSFFALLIYFIKDFPEGFSFSLSICPTVFMAVVHTLKRRYK